MDNDLIRRQDAIDAIRNDRIDTSEPYISVFKATGDLEKVESVNMACDRHIKMLKELPSAHPDNRLFKIADLVEGTIDHFDLDDAMDLLYQIKEVLK